MPGFAPASLLILAAFGAPEISPHSTVTPVDVKTLANETSSPLRDPWALIRANQKRLMEQN